MKHLTLALLIAVLPAFASAFEFKVSANTLVDELRETSLLTPLASATPAASAQDVVAAAQADYARLVGLMYDRGFFAPQVSILVDGREAAALSPVQPPRQIKSVILRVETGVPFKFGTAQIAPLATGTKLPEGFAPAQTATTSVLVDTVDAGIAGWRDQGHAKAALANQTITAHHNTARLDAAIKLDPGPRLRFGDLLVNGNQRMRNKRIVDIAGLPTGHVYNPAEVARAAQRLRRTGVFSVVSLSEADEISSNDTLDIVTQFSEAKTRRFGFGAELSTQDGLGLSAFWLQRNLFGGAERLRISGEIDGLGGTTGGEDYKLTVAFGRPATFNEDTDFYSDFELSSLNEPNYSTDLASIEAGIHRYASEKREYRLGFGFEAGESTDAFGARSYSILYLPLVVEFDYRNNILNATKGYYAKASLTPFLSLNGTSNGARGHFDARAYHTVGDAKRVTLALRGQVGFVSGPSLQNAPASYLFYSGGGGSVRGQDYQSLGVDIGGGNVVGGKAFLGFSGEVRVKTGNKLSLVGFYDAGYVGAEEFPDGSSGQWHTGAGVGVRYDTGIGPVRLDVGVPLSGPEGAGGVGLYIGIGQSF